MTEVAVEENNITTPTPMINKQDYVVIDGNSRYIQGWFELSSEKQEKIRQQEFNENTRRTRDYVLNCRNTQKRLFGKLSPLCEHARCLPRDYIPNFPEKYNKYGLKNLNLQTYIPKEEFEKMQPDPLFLEYDDVKMQKVLERATKYVDDEEPNSLGFYLQVKTEWMRRERKRFSALSLEEMIAETKRQTERDDADFNLWELQPEDNLIRKWAQFGVLTQDSYDEFHTASMMALISHLIPAEMRPQYGIVSNNMWFILIANSGTSGKSMSCKATVALSFDEIIATYTHFLSAKITTEAMIIQFADNSAKQFHFSDECVGFLKLMKKDYAADLPEEFIKAYDGTKLEKHTVKLGYKAQPHPRLSVLWNTTPETWAKYALQELFESGFYLRACFIIPERRKPIKRDEEMSEECKILKKEVIDELIELCQLVAKRGVYFKESEYINDWKYDLRKKVEEGKYSAIERSTLVRVYDQARKAAMNLTLTSREFYDYLIELNLPEAKDGAPWTKNEITYEIPDEIAEIACNWAEHVFLKYSIKAQKLTYGMGHYGKVMKKLLAGEKLSHTEIGDIVGKSGLQLKGFIADLPVVSYEEKTAGAKRPTTFYKLE